MEILPILALAAAHALSGSLRLVPLSAVECVTWATRSTFETIARPRRRNGVMYMWVHELCANTRMLYTSTLERLREEIAEAVALTCVGN